jgi:hypothetical protein
VHALVDDGAKAKRASILTASQSIEELFRGMEGEDRGGGRELACKDGV